jgi:prevent-host-death family protein
MKTVGAYAAKAHFSELLREVEQGETVVVTRHGVPVAHITPVGKNRADIAAAIEELHRYRRDRRPTLNGITLRELIEEGRV